MGLLLQIIGVLLVVASLVMSIISIVGKDLLPFTIPFLVGGILLINIGRRLH